MNGATTMTAYEFTAKLVANSRDYCITVCSSSDIDIDIKPAGHWRGSEFLGRQGALLQGRHSLDCIHVVGAADS